MIFDEGAELLDDDQCLALLAATSFGRVGVTIGALPVILPVNFAVHDGDIVFATRTGTKLRAAVRQAIIAFEVDAIDPATRSGWSVLAVGSCGEVTDPALCSELQSCLDPYLAERDHVVRMTPEFLSGRRIIPPANTIGSVASIRSA
jgi:nitroimidazol reductase NimA-like FMN-containing flavoprotein (pyridoxamine 5'-phosphate oxidase superfamily)